jgi:hypothetical protein
MVQSVFVYYIDEEKSGYYNYLVESIYKGVLPNKP